MIVLGIESSCDETAVGLVQMDGATVLANAVASQYDTHRPYGGVVPELASREHLKNLGPVVHEALRQAGLAWEQIDGLAVTYGPGLAGCLHMGLSAAKALALARGLPWIGVNHLEGHALAPFLEHADLGYPFVSLVVSGGHTSLLDVRGPFERYRLEATLDDAAGEAFDKVAKLLELGFPGGPAVDALTQGFKGQALELPKARPKDGGAGFSYSGLKTAVRMQVDKAAREGRPLDKAALAAGFQRAAILPLVKRAVELTSELGYKDLAVGGGVAANRLLRSELMAACEKAALRCRLSSPALCADNGAMIAYAGGLRLAAGQRSALDLGVAPGLDEVAA